MRLHEITDVNSLSEDYDIEVKKAAGRNGNGELPQDFWPTYSAMANTSGGIVLLGIEEKPRGVFTVFGIQNCEKVKKALWDGLNNRSIISSNVIDNSNVVIESIEDKNVIKIEIPKALRKQKPVYVGSDPFKGTYRRGYNGDYRCDAETVKRMMAEQVEETRDARLLEGFGFDDLNIETFRVYRTHFQNKSPNHPWNDHNDTEFLRQLGGWTRDRQTGNEGLTLAGLLMFGRLRSILDAVPNYIVDYQERPRAVTEQRWIDRLTTDGTWSGNLFDFYRMVIQRLFRDLKVPFRLEGNERQDETPVHEALREALVNTLIHADYTGRVSILVVKRPDLFGFRNPGGLRIPLRDAIIGGQSDCRNRNLQKMFQMIGWGEQAGSGLPKIYRGWNKQHWRRPEIIERTEVEQTLLTLRMISLLPEDTLIMLDNRFGSDFRKLPEVQRLAMATAAIEGSVTHHRLSEISMEHTHDISRALAILTEKGWLESDGVGRGTFYFLPGEHPLQKDGIFAEPLPNVEKSSEHLPESSEHLPESFEHLPESSEHFTASFEQMGEESGRFKSISEETMQILKKIAEPIRTAGKAPKSDVENAIIHLCETTFLSLAEIAELLNRSGDSLRNHYLNRMADEGILVREFPNLRNHPKQRYGVRKSTSSDEN